MPTDRRIIVFPASNEWETRFSRDVSSVELHAMYEQCRNSHGFQAILTHPNCPQEAFDDVTRKYLGVRKDTPRTMRSAVLSAVAARTSNSRDMWQSLVDCGDVHTVLRVARNEHAPAWVLSLIASRRNSRDFLVSIARNPSAPLPALKSVMKKALNQRIPGLRVTVASDALLNPSLTVPQRTELFDLFLAAHSQNGILGSAYRAVGVRVVEVCAESSEAPVDLLEKIFTVHDPRRDCSVPQHGARGPIIQQVLSNPNTPAHILEDTWDWYAGNAPQTNGQADGNVRTHENVMATVYADRVVRHRNCPPRVLREAATGPHLRLAAAAMQHPNCPADAAVFAALATG